MNIPEVKKRTLLSTALARPEFALCILIAAELVIFQMCGRRFLTSDNIWNIFRHSTEIALLALAMQPVILTGGIDLSVGSLLGLCTILFGQMVEIQGFSPASAAAVTLCIGALGGSLNAGLIALLRLPPLIVTLGTYSLYRGLAEALTRGTVIYSKFPPEFIALGNQSFLGVPEQIWVLAAVAAGMWILVHRMTHGRMWRAIGFAPSGAGYAALPVRRQLAFAYIMAGVIAALAALIYTARVTQAGADAGTGYELVAITAVVLGGTSIFGGIGTVHGTLLGVAAIAILSNGLGRIPVLSGLSQELTGILTGALLLIALAGKPLVQRLAKRRQSVHTPASSIPVI